MTSASFSVIRSGRAAVRSTVVGSIVLLLSGLATSCAPDASMEGRDRSWGHEEGAPSAGQPGGQPGGQQDPQVPDRPSPDQVPADAKAEVAGTAQDAKGGAVIDMPDGRVVYVEGLDSWPQELKGKQVNAVGRLVVKPHLPVATVAPDGAVSQGAEEGEQWVLENATWEAAPAEPSAPVAADAPAEGETGGSAADPAAAPAAEPSPPASTPPAEPPAD